MPRFHASGRLTTTRKSSHEVLRWFAKPAPSLSGEAPISHRRRSRRSTIPTASSPGLTGGNLHFGIREAAPRAIVNGLNLPYFRAYGSTFLVFSDYIRGSVRLAALMRLPSIFVYTHDSNGLGEDGPTHAPGSPDTESCRNSARCDRALCLRAARPIEGARCAAPDPDLDRL